MLAKLKNAGVRIVYRVCPECRRQTIVQIDGLDGDTTLNRLGEALPCVSCEAAASLRAKAAR